MNTRIDGKDLINHHCLNVEDITVAGYIHGQKYLKNSK